MAHHMTQTSRSFRVRGVSLIEVLLGIIIVTVASIATLSYFAYGMGGVGKTGHKRAALERARERLEQMLVSPINDMTPSDGVEHWVSCEAGGNPCKLANPNADPEETVVVDEHLSEQPVESTVQWFDDPASAGAQNALELSVKVWFTANPADNEVNRVELRTLRTP